VIGADGLMRPAMHYRWNDPEDNLGFIYYQFMHSQRDLPQREEKPIPTNPHHLAAARLPRIGGQKRGGGAHTELGAGQPKPKSNYAQDRRTEYDAPWLLSVHLHLRDK
jgi:hypothetical protein